VLYSTAVRHQAWASVVLILITTIVITAAGLVTVRRLADRRPAAAAVTDAGTGRSAAAAASPLVASPPAAPVRYAVQPGDTLSTIAQRFGTTVESLVAANGLRDADAIVAGQELVLRLVAERDGPSTRVIPDSELVYGPAYLDFDTQRFVAAQPGYLRTYTEAVNGVTMTGPEIVDRIARDFLVGPRVLLAAVEAASGWVTGSPRDAAAEAYPAGLADPARSGLWRQLNWLADRLNGGYYDWQTRDSRTLVLADGTVLAGQASLGPGSFAVQAVLARQSTAADLTTRLAAFQSAYARLFGDPWGRQRPVPDPAQLKFPALQLPWPKDQRWWLTGGPHGGWADGSAWAALDFVPDEEQRGCFVSSVPARAVAAGTIVEAGPGQLWLDLDGDGRRETGPAVFYLHLTAADGVTNGLKVQAGDVLGYPSCEGGSSNATHLHMARAVDGEWLAAGGAAPFTLGGWQAIGTATVYDGRLVHQDHRERVACECRQEGYNDVRW
jgi:LasA protease